MNKVIVKQGYLKKLPNAAKLGSSFKRPERRWFVFGVIGEQEPYIEYYEDEEGIFTNTPVNFYTLKGCTKVEAAVRLGKHANIFTIVTSQREISLLAPSSHVMDEWCRSIQRKLIDLKVLEEPSEHIYTPGHLGVRPSSRRPPPPVPFEDNGINEVLDREPPCVAPRQTRSISLVDGLTGGQADISLQGAAGAAHSPSITSPPAYTELDTQATSRLLRPLSLPSDDLASFSPLPSYTFSPGDDPATGMSTYLNSAAAGTPDLSVLPEKMVEALGLSDEAVGGWNNPPSDDGAPPPYMPRGAHQVGKSLKQSQTERLLKEKDHPGGVKANLSRLDCHNTIAFVDWHSQVWIAGWNQEMRPFLHNAFHIGDRVVSINGQVLESSTMARKLIKNSGDMDTITIILQRIPYGKPIVFSRKENGVDLGIRRAGGTAEVLTVRTEAMRSKIIDVEPFGTAAQHGLSAKTSTPDGSNLCNWYITEINQRPLNLFYKDDEIEHRLQAVGKEISILVQPADFIQELKKQLKAMKFYKDYIVQ